MNDPIGAYDKVCESYLLYVKTAFATQFPGLEAERDRLLRKSGVVAQEPWIEPMPRYESSGKGIRDLDADDVPGLDGRSRSDFIGLASCGLVGDYPLHRHQVEMLGASLAGRNSVVTAGTGSGKTEAFLLPLFAYLARESAAWSSPDQIPEHWDD